MPIAQALAVVDDAIDRRAMQVGVPQEALAVVLKAAFGDG